MISIVKTMDWHRLLYLNGLSQACTRLIPQHLDIPFTLRHLSLGPSSIPNFHVFNHIPDDFVLSQRIPVRHYFQCWT
jgi:hypothetical protein